jgi:hypothetical protein
MTNDPFFAPSHGSRATGPRAQDRRRRDLVGIFLQSLSGPSGSSVVSELTLVAVRKAADLTVAAEMARARILAGDNNAADLDCLVKLEGEARRAVRALGFKTDAKKPHAGTSPWSPLKASFAKATSEPVE